MQRGSASATTLERVAAVLLVAGLLAGPAASHVYWTLGGTWGLHRSLGGRVEESTTVGIRVVAAVVLVLVVVGVLVVLARVGLWEQTLVSGRTLRLLAWGLAGFLLLEALANFTYSRVYEWWLYGPVSLALGLLALVVARSGAARRPTARRPRRRVVSS